MVCDLDNPFPLDISEAEHKQNDAEYPEDNEVKHERHDMLTVNCPVEDIDTVGYR